MKRRVNEISKFTFGTKSEVFCPSTNVIQGNSFKYCIYLIEYSVETHN